MMNRKIGFLGVCCVALVGAGFLLSKNVVFNSAPDESDSEVTSSIRVGVVAKPIPKGGGSYRVGNPYVIAGRTYVPQEDPNYRAEGVASWYGDPFHGRLTANGEKYDMHALTAAHPTLPLPSYARVTNLENNLSIVVRLNDRGPYHDNRLIDMSVKAAKLLNFHDRGLTRVRVEYLGRAELEGSDDDKLVESLRFEEPAEIEIVGSARQTASLDRSNLSIVPAAGIDGSGTVSEPARESGTETQDAIEDLFPKVIFD